MAIRLFIALLFLSIGATAQNPYYFRYDSSDFKGSVKAKQLYIDSIEAFKKRYNLLSTSTGFRTINGFSILGTGDINFDTVNLSKRIDSKLDTGATLSISKIANLQSSLDAKQNVLTSGVTLRTVNNQSLLGAGNIPAIDDTTSLSNRINAKQDALISGSNIKTINGTSVLGSGNISIAGSDTSSLSYRINSKYSPIYSDSFNIKGDGSTDDAAAIQTAIGFASSTGRPLKFRKGVFLINANIQLLSNVTIEGEGDATEFRFTNGSSSPRYMFQGDISAYSNITFRNLKINCNRSGNSGAQVWGVKFNNCSNLKFEGVTFTGSKGTANLRLYLCKNVTVSNCTFDDDGAHAMQFYGGENINVINSKIQNWAQLDATKCALSGYVFSVSNAKVIGNTFVNSAGQQFAIETAGAYMDNWDISNNTFEDDTLGGSGISGQFVNSSIAFNKFKNGVGSQRSGIEISGHHIECIGNIIDGGNIIFNGLTNLAGFPNNGTNLRIAFNQVTTRGVNNGGIHVAGKDSVPVKEVDVLYNYVNTTAATGNSSAIFVGTYGGAGIVNNINFVGNTIYSMGYGFRMQAAAGSSNIYLADNKIMAGTYWMGYLTDTYSGIRLFNNRSYIAKGDTIQYVVSATNPIVNILSSGTDTTSLSNRINAKQDALVSGTNIKTINGSSVLGSGNLSVSTTFADSLQIESHPRIAAWGNSLTASYPSTGDSTYPAQLSRITGYNVVNFGESGATSTQILANIRNNPQAKDWSTIFWLGRNNFSDSSRVIRDIDSAVTELGHDRYIVLSILNGGYASELKNTPNYNRLKWVNDSLSRKYGNHFKDIRSWMVNQYNPSIPQDVIDFGNDVPPSSLRSDNIHLNDAGYRKVAEYISQNMTELIRPDTAISARSIGQIFNKPQDLGFIQPARVFSTRIGVNNKNPKNDIDLGKGNSIGFSGVQAIYIPDIATNNPSERSSNYIFSTGGRKLYDSLGTGIQANSNTSLGWGSADSLTSGYRNLFAGNNSGKNTKNGHNNTFIGSQSGLQNTSGYENTGIGASTLGNFISAYRNTSIGYSALSGATNASGIENTVGGYFAASGSTTARNNAVWGSNAAKNITTGSFNTIIGSNAAENIATASNTSIYGYFAGRSNTTSGLHAFGYYSLTSNTTGSRNSAFGNRSAEANTTGSDNSAFGDFGLNFNKTGSRNTSLGSQSGKGVINSSDFSDNTLLGYNTGQALLTAGSRNLFIGSGTGSTITTGADNIYIGYDVEPSDITASNRINIGNAIFGTGTASGTTLAGGYFGVKKSNPLAAWHVGGKLMIDTITTGSGTDSVLVVNGGEVRKIAQSSISGGGGGSTDTTSLSARIDAATFNPSKVYDEFTDFENTSALHLFNTFTSSGSVTNTTSGGAGNRPGILALSTGSSATGRAAIATGVASYVLGGGQWIIEGDIRVNGTLSNETERYQLVFGLGDAVASASQTDGVYFIYDEGGVSTGTASANWQIATSSNSTRTYSTTSTSVAVDTWYKLKIVVNASASSVEFFINNTSVGTITTNIPSGTGREVGALYLLIKSTGTTARSSLADWVRIRTTYTTER